MKKWRKTLIFSGVLLLLTFGIAAMASAAGPILRFCWDVDGREISILPFEKKERTWVLFVPAALKGKDPVIRIDQDTDLVWGDQTIPNGGTLKVEQFLGQPVTAAFATGRRIGEVTVMMGSEIPSLFFTIDPDELRRINANTKLTIRKDGSLIMLNGDGSIGAEDSVPGFKTRGNSTFFAGKRAFQFKMEHKAPLCGMERNKTWILLANWFDISLVRTQMVFDLYRDMGMKYTPDCRQAELYINGSYYGTYLLTEKIQMKKGRLEITDLEEALEGLNGEDAYDGAAWRKGRGKIVSRMRWFDIQEPEDITGGFLLEIEKELHYSQMNDVAGFVTEKGTCVVIKEPTHAGPLAVEYMANLFNDFHSAVLRKDGTSKDSGKYYASFIDMRSFALKIIMDEFSTNYEVRAGSQFLYKDSDRVNGKLYAGPPWDYDLSFGNKDDGVRNPRKKDYVFNRSSSEVYLPHWLLTHDDFRMITRQLYDEVFLPAAEVLAGRRKPSEKSSVRPIQAYQDAIRDSAAMNFTRWSARAIPDVWNSSGRSFEDAGAFLQNWISERLDLMTESWLLEEDGK